MSYTDDPEYRAWVEDVRTGLIPKLEESAITVSLIPEGETDIKFAVELGLSIMLDKPIIAVVGPGVRVPERLLRVADEVVEGDVTTEAGQAELMEKLTAMMKRLGIGPHESPESDD